MTRQHWISRACHGLLAAVLWLLRGAGALCAVVGSLLILLFKHGESSEGEQPQSSFEDPRGDDDMTARERETVAETNGWNSW